MFGVPRQMVWQLRIRLSLRNSSTNRLTEKDIEKLREHFERVKILRER